MTNILTGLSIVCILYYVAIVLYAGITADFAWIWILGAVALFGLGRAVHYSRLHPCFFPFWLKYVTVFVITAGILVFSILSFGIIRGMNAKGSKNLDYVVVLGAQVKGDVPSRALKKRLDKALEYANENPDTILILSGGQGSGEDITEARCMKEYLVQHGISEARLILEDKSTTTRENLLFQISSPHAPGKIQESYPTISTYTGR